MNDPGLARAGRTLHALARVAVLLALVAPASRAGAQAPAPAAEAPRATQSASRYAATIRDGRAAARALLRETGAASLSLALISNDRVVWRQGFGYADKATATPPSANTMYGIGSVSKMLATVATMKLVDMGLVSLDEPLAHYLPSFTMQSPGYRQVTVRMLINHSSGFPGSVYGDALTGEYFPGYLQDVMDTLARQRLKHTPGFLSVYCNDGFTMVEELVPAVTGKTFPEFVQEEILTPLGMTHTAYPLAPFANDSYAKAYDGDVARRREVLNVLASGGAYSTPTDMGRLATMLMNHGAYGDTRILSAASVAEMGMDQTRHSFNPAPYEAARYGLGWDSISQPGLKAVGFTGWMKGGDSGDYHAGFVIVPKAKLSAVVIGVAPLTSGQVEALAERILLHALVDRGALRRMPARIAAVAPPLRKATGSTLAAMQGYWAGNGTVLRVRASESDPQALTVSTLGSGSWATMFEGLRLRTDKRFHATGSANSMRTLTAEGHRYLVYRMVGGYGHYRDDFLLAQKLQPGEPLSATWQARVGGFWLPVNERPDSATYTDGEVATLVVGDVPGLAGYVTITTGGSGLQVVDPSESAWQGLMFLQIPGFGSRDMNDAVVEERGGEEWIRYGSTVYRPADRVPALADGANPVTFGPEGYAQWRTLPGAATGQIDGGTAWYLYGADLAVLDGGTTFPATLTAPAGAYLVVFGPVGSSSTVTIEPAAGERGRADGQGRATAPSPAFVPPLGPVIQLR